MFLGVDLMNINDVKNSLISEIEKLVEIIKKEYPNLVDIPIEYDLKKVVHIEETGTISLFVSDKNFYFPLDAFKVLGTLKKIPGFGMMKNHKTCDQDNMIINDNTYITYIKHVFLKGLTPEEYFKEILLHETLHFCGSGGGTAIREGINELKTRQLAKKYGLLTSSCGYPKETKIAYELEKIFGEDIINKISFSKSYRKIKEILDSVSPEASSPSIIETFAFARTVRLSVALYEIFNFVRNGIKSVSFFWYFFVSPLSKYSFPRPQIRSTPAKSPKSLNLYPAVKLTEFFAVFVM